MRLKGHDYSESGRYYFVTICTKDRMEWFGDAKDGKIILNECGKIARSAWEDIFQHFNQIELDEFVVMPNHIHGILFVTPNGLDAVGNGHAHSLQDKNPQNRSRETIPVVIGSYKSAVTRQIHQNGILNFEWQKSFHDRIIRTEGSLEKIREYILFNPSHLIGGAAHV